MAASSASAAGAAGTGPDDDRAGPGGGGGAGGAAAMPRHTSGLGQVIASASNFVRVEIHTELPEDAPTPPGWRPAHLSSQNHTTDPHPHQEPQHQPLQPPSEIQIVATTSDEPLMVASIPLQGEEQRAATSCQPEGAGAAPEPRRPVILCSVRALLRKLRQEVLVGDVVRVSSIDWGQGRGVVGEVLPRSSRTTDPDVANVDHMLLVMALDRPPFEPQQVSRFLVAAEASGLPFTLCLNKADLVPPYVLQRRLEQCRSWGYEPVVLSCETGEGVEQVAQALEGRISVVAGPSGAGKSSLINSLRLGRHRPDLRAEQQQQEGAEEGQEDRNGDNPPLPALPLQEALAAASISAEVDSECDSEGEGEAAAGDGGSGGSAPEEGEAGEGSRSRRRRAGLGGRKGEAAAGGGGEAEGGVEFLAVGELSRIGRGMHTTTSIRLLPLLGGGWLADTPGFGQPTLEGISSQQLAGCFPEVAALTSASPCRYRDCLHVAEPGCAVNGAGLERYGHYLRFLQEIRTREETDLRSLQRAKMEREGYARVKSSKGGTERLEVKLDGRKHRRQSRQSARQASEQQD